MRFFIAKIGVKTRYGISPNLLRLHGFNGCWIGGTLFDVRLHPVDILCATGAETRRRPIPHATNTPPTTANTNKLPAASIHSSPRVPNLLKPKPSSLIM